MSSISSYGHDDLCEVRSPMEVGSPTTLDSDESPPMAAGNEGGCLRTEDLNRLMDALDERSIKFQRMKGQECLPEAMMHDQGAVVPAVVVSPSNESEVVQTLQILTKLDLYHGGQAVSVKSGGHGYFNGATCADIMLNLSTMRQRKIEHNVLTLEPGCLLGHTIDLLARNHKAVPHGDCFGVGAGGHFTTAGWDILLARRYGLGCQSVVGGRLVLWDGTVWDVGDKDHRDLLYAMRGGAAAGTGVVTKIQLRLEEEPALATWQFALVTRDDLKHRLVAQRVFQRAESLPRDITVSLRFHYELGEDQPSCSFNVTSLLTAKETLQKLERHLGPEVSELVSDLTRWNEGSLLDLRLIPASDTLVKNPQMLAEMTARSLHDNPRLYWSEQQCLREMERSHLLSRSYWVTNDCDDMFLAIHDAFASARHHPCRERMYVLVVLGGGRMLDSDLPCAMPLGQVLARFESHWLRSEHEGWCHQFAQNISNIIQLHEDPVPHRPYRGDIWLPEQASDIVLDNISATYDTRVAEDRATS